MRSVGMGTQERWKKNYNMSINKRRTKAMAVGQFNVVFGQMGATQVLKK